MVPSSEEVQLFFAPYSPGAPNDHDIHLSRSYSVTFAPISSRISSRLSIPYLHSCFNTSK